MSRYIEIAIWIAIAIILLMGVIVTPSAIKRIKKCKKR